VKYWQASDSICADLLATGDNGGSVEACVGNILRHQVFLGCVTLQQQAKQDVIRLVEQLDQACIRFVFYSAENEIRVRWESHHYHSTTGIYRFESRVFAEKCGLETGWNCHISLAEPNVEASTAKARQTTSESESSFVHCRYNFWVHSKSRCACAHLFFESVRHFEVQTRAKASLFNQQKINIVFIIWNSWNLN